MAHSTDPLAAAVPPDHLLGLLGMRDVATPEGADLAVAMPVTPRTTNPDGSLQGGLIATLVDVTAGRAARGLAVARHGEAVSVPTADLVVHYLSGVRTGPAVAVARVRRAGRTSIVVQVDVHDSGRDVLCAVATLAFAVVPPRGT